MTLLRHFLAPPLRHLNRAKQVLVGGGNGLRILLLHDIPEQQLPALDKLVGWLRAEGRLVDPSGAEAWLEPHHDDKRPAPCLVSFDDGFASNLAAAQVLEDHGSRGLFFVCPGLMNLDAPTQRQAIAANIFDGKITADSLPDTARLMNWDEVRQLELAGHTIGNHTMSHRRLTRLSADECDTEIGTAAAILAERLSRQVHWFAFPFGDIESVNATTLATAGRYHRFCRSGVRGPNATGVNRFALRADHIDLSHPPAYRRLIAEGGLDSRYRQARRRLDDLAIAASTGLR